MKRVLILYSKTACSYPSFFTDDEEMEETAYYISNVLNKKYIKNDLMAVEKDLKPLLNWYKKERGVILNLCEHICGDYRGEYKVALFMEKNKIPFTGNGSKTLKIAQNKKETKRVLKKANLKVLPFVILNKNSSFENIKLKYPLIVKPLYEDGSAGINKNSFVKDLQELKRQANFLINMFCEPVIVEPFLFGREFNVSVIGRNKKIVLPISEIDYSKLPNSLPPFLTYDAKWKKNDIYYKNTKPICPAKVSKKLERKIKEIALKAGEVLCCRDYYRVDIRLDEKGEPFVLEVNPNPDISPDAGLHRALKAKNIEYGDFILRLIRWAS